jgi:hypothetical protein
METSTIFSTIKNFFKAIRKSRHYILAGTNLLVSTANVGMLYFVFGSGIETAAYFISTNAIAALNLLLLTFVEQFAFIFSSRYISCQDSAEKFFWTAMWVVTILGTLVCFITYANVETLLKFYSPGLQGLNHSVAVSITKIVLVLTITTTPLYLIQQKLGCLSKISGSYLIGLMPNIINLMGLGFAWLLHWDIYIVLKLHVIGSTITLLTAIFLLRDSLTGLCEEELKHLRCLAWQSAKIRTAHNIHNIFSNYLISLAISYIPVNLGSFFFGVKRGADALTQIAIGPLVKSLPPKIIQSIQIEDFENLLEILKYNKSRILIFYFFTIIISLVAILYAQSNLGWFTADRFYHYSTCLSLLSYSCLNSVLIPYSMIAAGFGRSGIFYASNTIFCLCLGLVTVIVIQYKYDWMLPVGLLMSQFVLYHVNMGYIKKSYATKSN